MNEADRKRFDDVMTSCARTEQAVTDLAKHVGEITALEREARQREIDDVREDARRQGGGAGGILGTVMGGLVAWGIDTFSRGAP